MQHLEILHPEILTKIWHRFSHSVAFLKFQAFQDSENAFWLIHLWFIFHFYSVVSVLLISHIHDFHPQLFSTASDSLSRKFFYMGRHSVIVHNSKSIYRINIFHSGLRMMSNIINQLVFGCPGPKQHYICFRYGITMVTQMTKSYQLMSMHNNN